ncbi:MAG: DUF4365 domain-containing protein [Caldilineaceae bacterium]|nr:DUF4365 domain-containing protein [Caldilineaceae bacterium]
MGRTDDTDNNIRKERFSLAYIRAVAAHAGYYTDEPQVDRRSIDGILRADFGRGPRIEFQAKATSQDILRENDLAFPLPIGNYRDLSQDAMIPRILIVVLMPQERAQWLQQTSSELCLRHCAYWLSLKEQPPVPNTTSVTVHIPVANIFGSEQLSVLMERVERGESV